MRKYSLRILIAGLQSGHASWHYTQAVTISLRANGTLMFRSKGHGDIGIEAPTCMHDALLVAEVEARSTEETTAGIPVTSCWQQRLSLATATNSSLSQSARNRMLPDDHATSYSPDIDYQLGGRRGNA